MNYLTRAIIYNLLVVIQFGGYALGWIFVFWFTEDAVARAAWVVFYTYLIYTVEQPFFMPFKEPPELISIVVSVGKKEAEG